MLVDIDCEGTVDWDCAYAYEDGRLISEERESSNGQTHECRTFEPLCESPAPTPWKEMLPTLP